MLNHRPKTFRRFGFVAEQHLLHQRATEGNWASEVQNLIEQVSPCPFSVRSVLNAALWYYLAVTCVLHVLYEWLLANPTLQAALRQQRSGRGASAAEPIKMILARVVAN